MTPGEIEQLGPVVAERVSGKVNGAEVLSLRRRGHGPQIARIGFRVEQQPRNVHPTDAVRQRVVKLHYERRLPVLKAFDERELPERPISIQTRHARLASELQDCVERLG